MSVRHRLAERFGAPTEQEGSVNEPRTQVEHGVRWNEKWTYRDPDGDGRDRIILWDRYDLAGVFRVQPGGGWAPEPSALA